jgi:hypothetical protein
MGDIALALSLGGDAEGSRKTFEEALKAVSQIEKPSDRISALLDLPRKLAKAGDVNGALDVTSQIDDPRSRGEALLGISEEQAMLGDLVGAKTTIAVALGAADQIEHALSRSVFLSNVARSKAVGGDINGAFATADRIGDDEWRASAYVYIGDSGDAIPI